MNDLPTKSGRCYSRKLLFQIAEQIEKQEHRFGTLGQKDQSNEPIHLKDVAFTYSNPIVEEDENHITSLYVDINIISEDLKQLIGKTVFRPNGIMENLSEFGSLIQVNDTYKLCSVSAIPTHTDALNLP
jgi:hypothetical protein